jgi:hypothetical protein
MRPRLPRDDDEVLIGDRAEPDIVVAATVSDEEAVRIAQQLHELAPETGQASSRS